MKTFKDFIKEMSVGGMATNVISSPHIAKYDPIMKFKMFRRKSKKK